MLQSMVTQPKNESHALPESAQAQLYHPRLLLRRDAQSEARSRRRDRVIGRKPYTPPEGRPSPQWPGARGGSPALGCWVRWRRGRGGASGAMAPSAEGGREALGRGAREGVRAVLLGPPGAGKGTQVSFPRSLPPGCPQRRPGPRRQSPARRGARSGPAGEPLRGRAGPGAPAAQLGGGQRARLAEQPVAGPGRGASARSLGWLGWAGPASAGKGARWRGRVLHAGWGIPGAEVGRG